LAEDLVAASHLHSLVSTFNGHSLRFALQKALAVAIEIAHADLGNIQLVDAETGALRIVAHRGFGREFLRFFRQVHPQQGACGTALQSRSRVIVQDVTDSPIFGDAKTIEVLLAAGVRAVQSTPLLGESGELLGMISTHWRMPRRLQASQAIRLDALAQSVSRFIEWRAGARGPAAYESN